MPQGWTWGAGGSKTLAWGFAMVPHRLRILVYHSFKCFIKTTCPSLGL